MAKRVGRREQVAGAKEVVWRGHFRGQRQSGLSIREYCIRHELSSRAFTHGGPNSHGVRPSVPSDRRSCR
jgi:hypothetical protein